MRIWIEELGAIRYKWALCRDGIARQLGRANESNEVIIDRAEKAVQAKEKADRLEAGLRSKYPDKQIYSGFLPASDVEWDEQGGYYLYILKDRKKHGKYQVQEAVLLNK